MSQLGKKRINFLANKAKTTNGALTQSCGYELYEQKKKSLNGHIPFTGRERQQPENSTDIRSIDNPVTFNIITGIQRSERLAPNMRPTITIDKGAKESIFNKNTTILIRKASLAIYIRESSAWGGFHYALQSALRLAENRMQRNKDQMCSIGSVSAAEKQTIKRKTETLVMVGLGYRFLMLKKEKVNKEQGSTLILKVGYSHMLYCPVPENIQVSIQKKNTRLRVRSFEKNDLTRWVACIQKLRLPDSYKGKGIRKENQIMTLKERS